MSHTLNRTGVGRPGFVAEFGLHGEEQRDAAEAVLALVKQHDLRTIRVIVVDQHGQPRAKFLSAAAFEGALRNGVDFSGAIYSLDTGNHVFPPAFAEGGGFGIEEFTGFPDVVIVPDPLTFQVLPWADRTGWVLCDAYFSSGKPVPLCGRRILRSQLEQLADRGLTYLSGLEVEFTVTRLTTPVIGLNQTGHPAPPPDVSVLQQGYQYLSETRLDGVWELLQQLRDGLIEIGLAPRSMEDEWGPGQLEFTLPPLEGLGTADAMVLFRSAVKQLCSRNGYQATFMAKPKLPNFFGAGWHLHSSLVDSAGKNAYLSDTELLSPLGKNYVAGLLAHAEAMSAFATPTITGYERYAPYSFAPDRICWAADNRGALIRIQGGPGDTGTHIENRMGEPAANPYLYLAADLAAGLDGLASELQPPAPVSADPYAIDATRLPESLGDALKALDASDLYRARFGDGFIDYYLMMKQSEVVRYAASFEGLDDPTEIAHAQAQWQMAEYFEFF
jgi:glutamine synthetase